MYEELVKDLRYLAKVYSVCENENTQEYKLAVKAADAIEELSKQHEAQRNNLIALLNDKPRWVPVEERLPKSVCKSYLCLTDTGYHCEARWTNNVYGLRKSDNKWGWSIADVPQHCKVTHWRRLPDPPKGDE